MLPTEIITYVDHPATIPLETYDLRVWNWLFSRQQLLQHNKDPKFMGKLIVSELEEVLEELEKGNITAQNMETLDVIFLILGVARTNNIHFEYGYILASINGQGRQFDSAFPHAIEVAGNLNNHNLEKDLPGLLILVSSILGHLPKTIGPKQISRLEEEYYYAQFFYTTLISMILKKNIANYPLEVFDEHNPHYPNPLTPDQISEAYVHGRTCLRLIRDYQLKVLERQQAAYGINKEDWEPFSELIFDFEQSQPNIELILKRLKEAYPPADNALVELDEDNRLSVRRLKAYSPDDLRKYEDNEYVHHG